MKDILRKSKGQNKMRNEQKKERRRGGGGERGREGTRATKVISIKTNAFNVYLQGVKSVMHVHNGGSINSECM